MGLDDAKLDCRFQGKDYRLTDDSGNIVTESFA